MRRTLLAAVAALALTGPVWGQQDEITGVIGAQLDAFLVDDFATAFTFASPMIKGMFGSAEVFGRMVQQGYPMVWRPADVQYLNLEERAGQLVQRVQITDQQGRVFSLDYYMIETAEGWQINGVQILRTPDVGV